MNIEKFSVNFVIIILAVFLIMTNLSALNVGTCVTAEVSDISPSSIRIGEDFTVGVQVENCGTITPEFIHFELLNPPVDIEIKEPLEVNISELYYSNSERFLNYHMKIDDDAQAGTYVINTRLTYGRFDYTIIKNSNITIDVIGEKAELSIASLKTDPVLPRRGDTVELTLRVENTGDGTAKSVSVYTEHPFQGLKQSFIGSLDSDEDGPAVLTFIVNKHGEFEFPVNISYKDDFGENEISTNVVLNVLRKKTNIGIIVFVLLLLIALFGGGIYYFLKTKKAKEKIIHQLLQGESISSEEPKEHTKRHIRRNHKEKSEKAKKEKIKREFKKEMLRKYKK